MAEVTASPNLMLSYAVVVLLLIVPHYVFIHHYLHCMIAGPLLVWIGCQRALIEASKAPEDSQAEMVSKTDAMQFPLIGSAVLFGLYVVVKFVNKEYLDVLISCYFAILGRRRVRRRAPAARRPRPRRLEELRDPLPLAVLEGGGEAARRSSSRSRCTTSASSRCARRPRSRTP